MRTLNLSNPADARTYIDEFEIPGAPSKPDHVILTGGRKIELARMSDEDAVVVAHALHDLVEQAAKEAVKH